MIKANPSILWPSDAKIECRITSCVALFATLVPQPNKVAEHSSNAYSPDWIQQPAAPMTTTNGSHQLLDCSDDDNISNENNDDNNTATVDNDENASAGITFD